MESNIFQTADDISWEDLGDGVQRQMLGFDAKAMMVKVKFESGAIGSVHQHPHTQVTFVESGSFLVTIDGNSALLKKGDGFRVPSNALHGVKCEEAGVLVDVFSPLREDFIKWWEVYDFLDLKIVDLYNYNKLYSASLLRSSCKARASFFSLSLALVL